MNSEEKKLHDIGIADFVLTDLCCFRRDPCAVGNDLWQIPAPSVF